MDQQRIALIETNESILVGLRMLIDSQSDFKVVFEAQSAGHALQNLAEQLVDVVIVNSNLVGADGVVLTRQLIETFFESAEEPPKFIVWSAYYSDHLHLATLRAGASALVTQDDQPELLVESIRNLRSEISSTALTSLNFESYQPEIDHAFILKLAKLDDRQREVVEYIYRGFDLPKIAEHLRLPEFESVQLIKSVMRIFRCATLEQLYLIVRDSHVEI